MDINSDETTGPTDGDDNMIKDAFVKVVGKMFTMKVDPEGNILSVEGFDEIIKDIIDSAAVNEDMKLQMKVSLQDQFNEQQLKDEFSQALMIFPNKNVVVGDSWQKEYQRGGKIPAQFSTIYTVSASDDNRITLDAKTTISPVSKEMESKGRQTGTLLVDRKTGLVTSAQFKQQIDAGTTDLNLKINASGSITGKER